MTAESDPMVKAPAIRVSDAERKVVDDRLQKALAQGRLTLVEYEERAGQVWAARTEADLVPLTADLPLLLAAPVHLAPTGYHEPRRAFSFMADRRLKGIPAAGQPTTATAVMGHAVVDLRAERLPAVVEIKAVAVMGAVEVLVPVGVRVELNGIAIMGEKDETAEPPLPGAPVVRVQAFAFLASVNVGHGPRKKRVRLAR